MNILHLVGSVGPESFGLGPPPLNLAMAQHAAGHNVQIWCCSTPAAADWGSAQSGCPRHIIRTFPALNRKYSVSPSLVLTAGTAEGRDFDVVHLHGLWAGTSAACAHWHRNTGGPTVVAPQGTLSRWALQRSAWKKKLALLTYERSNLAGLGCFQAASNSEAADIAAFGRRKPVAILPNGISESWISATESGESFRTRFSLPSDRRIALFLSRISPVKGLPLLVEAIKLNHGRLAEWIFVIAGKDEFGHQAVVEGQISDAGLTSQFRFLGPLYGSDKRGAFAAAELFVLPTHSEGAPSVIVEALGAGVPVLTTLGSTWTQLEEQGCGWSAEIGVTAIADALQEAVALPIAALQQKGRRGQGIIREGFLWPRIAERSIDTYRWLLNGGEPPPWVKQ